MENWIELWRELPVYKKVIQAVNGELKPIHDELPEPMRRAEQLIREAKQTEDLFPPEIATSKLNGTRQEMIQAFYERNDDIFIKDGETLGCTHVVDAKSDANLYGEMCSTKKSLTKVMVWTFYCITEVVDLLSNPSLNSDFNTSKVLLVAK